MDIGWGASASFMKSKGNKVYAANSRAELINKRPNTGRKIVKLLHSKTSARTVNPSKRWLSQEWLNDQIVCGSTMTGWAKRLCAISTCFFAVYVVLILLVFWDIEDLSHNEDLFDLVLFEKLRTITISIFGTLSFCFSLLGLLTISNNGAAGQKATAGFGFCIAALACAGHLLHYFGRGGLVYSPGLTVLSTAGGGRVVVSRIQLGEWVATVPLMACALGHVLRVRARATLAAGAAQAAMLLAALVGMLAPQPVVAWAFLALSCLLFVPWVWSVYVLTFRLTDGLSGQTRNMKHIRLLGGSVCALWSACPALFFLGLGGALGPNLQRAGAEVADVLSKAAFLAGLLLFHFQDLASESSAALVDLKEASAAQKAFLRYVFHEVRVPFHSVLLGLEHLLDQDQLAEFRPLLQTLSAAAGTMDRAINDALLLARLQDARLTLRRAPFCPLALVRGVAADQRRRARARGVRLKCYVDRKLPAAVVDDAARLRQVLVHLISNAIKYSAPGGAAAAAVAEGKSKESKETEVLPAPEVVLSAELLTLSQEARTCALVLKVQDQGAGIPEAKQRTLFEGYRQQRDHNQPAAAAADAASGAAKGQGGGSGEPERGSGLGLSIMKRIVELHEGGMAFRSKEGVGTEFVVTLPLPLAEEDEEMLEEQISGRSQRAEEEVKEDRSLSQPKLNITAPAPGRVPYAQHRFAALRTSSSQQFHSSSSQHHSSTLGGGHASPSTSLMATLAYEDVSSFMAKEMAGAPVRTVAVPSPVVGLAALATSRAAGEGGSPAQDEPPPGPGPPAAAAPTAAAAPKRGSVARVEAAGRDATAALLRVPSREGPPAAVAASAGRAPPPDARPAVPSPKGGRSGRGPAAGAGPAACSPAPPSVGGQHGAPPAQGGGEGDGPRDLATPVVNQSQQVAAPSASARIYGEPRSRLAKKRSGGNGALQQTSSGSLLLTTFADEIPENVPARGGTILAPIDRGMVNNRKRLAEVQGTQTQLATPEEKPRILVVDDAPSILKLTRIILQNKYEVDTAEDGQVAVDMVKEKQYDLILMDFFMPVMNGAEATAKILHLRPGQRIVGITGNALEEDQAKFLKAGALEILLKPCGKQQLLAKVAHHLAKGGGGGGGAATREGGLADRPFIEAV